MTFRVNDLVQLKLYFYPGIGTTDPQNISAWEEFPAHNGNLINMVHISAAATMRVPAMKLSITDNFRFLEWLKKKAGLGIADGAHIKLVVINNEVETVRYFRAYSWSKTSAGDLGYNYELNCYWDSVCYWLQSTKVGMRGTSSQVLKNIANGPSKLGWYSGNEEGTADSQVWLPANRSFSDFAKAISQCGYVDNKSHMIFGIDSTGNMRYLNLNKETSESNLKKAVSLQLLDGEVLPSSIEKIHVAQEFLGKTRAGINNSLGGYAYSLVEQFLPNPKTTPAFVGNLLSGFDNNMDSAELSRNPDIPGKIQNRSIVEFRPVGVTGANGTVYEKYEMARSQNYLYNLLNSTVGEFAFHRPTEWEIGDRFFYRPPLSQSSAGVPELDIEMAGEYSVSSKTILVGGSSYVEKVIACRNGVERKSS